MRSDRVVPLEFHVTRAKAPAMRIRVVSLFTDAAAAAVEAHAPGRSAT
jgi:hypothetical protein